MSTSSNLLALPRRRRRRLAVAALVSALVFTATLLADSRHALAQGTPAEAQPSQSPTPTPDAPNGAAAKAEKGAADSLTGRVLGDGGEPLAGVRVMAYLSSASRANVQPLATTDESGNFKIDNLAPGLYNVTASLRGHVADPEVYPPGRPAPRHRPGDSVTIRLVKGGVVTGAVMSGDGEPLVAITVRAVYVRNLEGDTTNAGLSFGEDQTDDRGVYRIYGLWPGVYVLASAGAETSNAGWPGTPSPYRNESPTYYPSGTRDTASEVTVRAGQETAGIDIRHRGERGRRVTGVVSTAQAGADAGAVVTLTHAASGTQVGTSFAPRPSGAQAANERPFSFEGVADGEYEVQARPSGGFLTSSSAPQRVVVSGGDQTGLRLTLTPLASVSGSLVVEPSGEADRAKADCKETRTTFLPQESVVTTQHEDILKLTSAIRRAAMRREATPDTSGAFTLRGLEAGRYRFTLRLADDNWYVRDVQLPSAAAATPATPTAAATRPGAARKPNTNTTAAAANSAAPRETVELKAGQQLSGVFVRVAEGAASLGGRVAPREENAPLPPSSQLRVHLVPAAREQAENTLRYYEATPAPDGTFALKNLAPGRYLLLVRAADSEAPTRPAAWDSATRARLRREAEAANLAVELQQCQRTTGYTAHLPAPRD